MPEATPAEQTDETISTERRSLYEAIQMLCTGHRSEDVVQALGDSISSAVGFMARDLAEADQIIDSLPADLKRTVRDNWEYLLEVKAMSGSITERHHV